MMTAGSSALRFSSRRVWLVAGASLAARASGATGSTEDLCLA
jgi:hypothetical protein